MAKITDERIIDALRLLERVGVRPEGVVRGWILFAKELVTSGHPDVEWIGDVERWEEQWNR